MNATRVWVTSLVRYNIALRTPIPSPILHQLWPPRSLHSRSLFHMQNHHRRSIVAHCGIGSLGPVYHTSFISRQLLRASSGPLLRLLVPFSFSFFAFALSGVLVSSHLARFIPRFLASPTCIERAPSHPKFLFSQLSPS